MTRFFTFIFILLITPAILAKDQTTLVIDYSEAYQNNTSIELVQNDNNQQPHSITLAPGPIQISLNKSIQWLKADYQNLSLAQVLANKDSQFKNLERGVVINNDEVYWIRMRLVNAFKESIPLALSLASKNIFIEAAYKKTSNQWSLIQNIKPNTKLVGLSSLILNIESESDSWLYFRIKASSTTKLDARLQDISHYTQDLNFYQQLIGASLAVSLIIILFHTLAIQFHNHTRHYLVILISIISAIFISGYSPTPFLPNWLILLGFLAPWGIACMLMLSSYSSEYYKKYVFSNKSFFTVLSFILVALVLLTAPYPVLLFACLFPSIYAAKNSLSISINLFIACIIFIMNAIWQLFYSFYPELIYPPSALHEVYSLVLINMFVSISMITPYFSSRHAISVPQEHISNTQFISKLSHDFRTPMNGVLGMAELLKDTPLSRNQRGYLSTIEQSGHDLLRLINRISDIGKIQTGVLSAEIQTFDINDIVEKTIEKHIPLAEQNHVEIILNISPQVPSHVAGDESRLSAVLDNLILNALSKTKNGELEIKAQWLDNNQHDQVLFTISDSGDGISKETLKSLFSPNDITQITASDIQDIDAGLLLSKYIVTALKGSFEIESNSHIGTTIRFSMNLSPALVQPKTRQSNILNGTSILIVDDNATFRTVIQQYAESWGAQCDATYNGKEALALLRNHKTIEKPYDIMLIDQEMPILNGFQLASKIQADPDINQNIIKIMLTGTSISSQSSHALEAGIHQVITKPISARRLHSVLSKHLAKRNITKAK